MKKNLLLQVAAAGSLLGATLAQAQTDPMLTVRAPNIEPAPPVELNRISIAYRMGYDMSVKFRHLGGYSAQTDPGPATGTRQVHTYDDGYVLPDTREVDDNFTWNWGFNSPNQVHPGADTPYGSLVLHSSSSPATAVSRSDSDPEHGFEITYDRHLGKIGKLSWGIEAAFNWMHFSKHDSSTLSYRETSTTDTYALDGLNPFMPPPAPENTPYMGTPEGGYPGGGGPLIVDFPASRELQTSPTGALISGQRTLKASIYGFRLGPYIEAPLGNKFAASLSAGLAVVLINSDFSFTESVTISEFALAQTRSGGSSHSDAMAGGYGSGTLSYALDDDVRLFANAQYQHLSMFRQHASSKDVQLDLAGNLFFSAGVSFSF